MPRTRCSRAARGLTLVALTVALSACAIAPPRTDDPLQKFNRQMFAFNQFADQLAIRPAAKAYVKVTGPKGRVLIGNFFDNLRTPVTIVNDVLQGRPGPALKATGRFIINTTVGFLGIFDPASEMRLPANPTDFGVTLARWGVPEGPFLVLPFIGPTSARDVWRMPVDSYFDPLSRYARDHDLQWHAQYLPGMLYLMTLRAGALPLDPVIQSSYDPYVFVRDAYRQNRLYRIYYGDPPLSAIEQLQGTAPGDADEQDFDQLLQQQRQYEQAHPAVANGTPAAANATAIPAAPASTRTPAAASPPAAASSSH